MLISPREIEMIALLTIVYLKQYPTTDIIQTARHYTYTVGKTLVPEKYQDEFEKQFKSDHLIIEEEKHDKQDFLITASRAPAWDLLGNVLQLRNWRITTPGLTEEQQYAGLGGMILEGVPATGKSAIIIARLLADGYQPRALHDTTPPPENQKFFYHLPASMGPKEKERFLLTKSLPEGAITLIDEINASPQLEATVNAITMGKTPDGQRLETQKPGCLILGTRNPSATMSGRIAETLALARRFLTLQIPLYPQQELIDILENKGVSLKRAQELVEAYQFTLADGVQPTLRDLLALADEAIKIEKEKIAIKPIARPTEKTLKNLSLFNTHKKIKKSSCEPYIASPDGATKDTILIRQLA